MWDGIVRLRGESLESLAARHDARLELASDGKWSWAPPAVRPWTLRPGSATPEGISSI